MSEKLSIAKKLPKVSRPRLNRGISYHKMPNGDLKYRIRIRAQKMLKRYELDKPLDEVYDTLEAAEKRLLALKYKQDEVKDQFYKKGLEALSQITISQLLDEHYEQHYKHLKSATTHKSRLNVIKTTLIPAGDIKKRSIAGFFIRLSELDKSKIEFGNIPVKDYPDYINAFIAERKKKVKNQTIVNDLMFLYTALKVCGNYFSNLESYKEPLSMANFKQLRDQIEFREKRIKPKDRELIEEILIRHSRNPVYYNMFLFLIETGVRISEALSMKVKDIDLEKRTIFLISKKNEVRRNVGISAKLYPTIKQQIEGKKATDPIFKEGKDAFGTKLKQISKYLEPQGVYFNWHMCRHTFISDQMDKKPLGTLMKQVDITDLQHFQQQYLNPIRSEQIAMKVAQSKALTPEEIQMVGGHSDLAVTIGTYTHPDNETEFERMARENQELKKALQILLAKDLAK